MITTLIIAIICMWILNIKTTHDINNDKRWLKKVNPRYYALMNSGPGSYPEFTGESISTDKITICNSTSPDPLIISPLRIEPVFVHEYILCSEGQTIDAYGN